MESSALKIIFKKIIFVFIHAIIIANILFFGFEVISKRLNGDGINESIFYHLLNPMEGADISEFKVEIILSLAIISLIFFIIPIINKLSRKAHFNLIAFPIIFLLSTLNPGIKKTITHFTQHNISNEIPSYFKEWKIQEVTSEKNLVFIYLEGVEGTFTNEKEFPGLTPHINKLKKDGIYFENMEMPTGSEWTIAGMVASQCGLPLLTSPGSGNSNENLDKFLPKAKCLGDILKENDYINHYYGGADLQFAGKGKFYKNHGFDKVYGLDELKNRTEITGLSGWGVHDDDLLSIVKNDFEKIIKDNKKYSLFLLNLDTHSPFGRIPKSCDNINYGDGSIKILNSIHCTDILVSNFVNYLRERDPNAVIVLASDHLSMPTDAKHLLKNLHREKLFLVLNSNSKNKKIKKPSTTYDIGATVLNIIGFNNNGLGWGRDLINSESTRNQFPTIESYNENIKRYQNFHKSFHGIYGVFETIKRDDDYFIVNGERMKPPFSLKLSSSGKIDDIFFNVQKNKYFRYYENVLKDNKNKNFIFIDYCDNLKNTSHSAGNFCYIISKHKEKKDKLGIFEKELVIDKSLSVKNFEYREKITFNKKQYVPYETINFESRHEAIISAFPFEKGVSDINWNGVHERLKRGINFYSYDSTNKQLEILDHKDFCNPTENTEINQKLVSAIEKNNLHYKDFIYVAADSAWCDKNKYLEYINKIDLKIGLEEIGFREAAIYVKTDGKEYFLKSPTGIVFYTDGGNY